MIEWIIEKSVENRVLVLVTVAILSAAGLWAMLNTPVDAIPDLSDVQVIIYTDFNGQGPQIVQDQITYPITTSMLSVPYAKSVRGYSYFGFSMVYVIFEDGADIYWARSRVLEYLAGLQGKLPDGVTPRLGPDATGVGWVYMYTLTSDRHDLAQLRSIQDWFLRYELMSIQGVAEVASAGGYVKQYQIELDPEKMRAYGISLKEIKKAIKKSNTESGGRLLEMAETEFMVRGDGYISSIDDLKTIPVGYAKKSRTPILLSQVAVINIGPELRRGVIELNGQGEAVTGIIVLRFGGNALEVIKKVKKRLKELKAGLPEGVEIHTSYDRSNLILRAIDTLEKKLLEEMFVVALVIMLFLLHFRSSLVVIFSLPVGILISFLIMRLLGISANIMSLGGIAIAIGVMVDAWVVMVENFHKRKEKEPHLTQRDLVLKSSKEVGPALFVSMIIITISFLPVFTLQNQEGRLFTPLAYTKTFAMAASAFLAITITPVLMFFLIKGKIRKEKRNPISRFVIRIYKPIIIKALRYPKITVLFAIITLVATIIPYTLLGSEFMPPLNEGDLLYMPTTFPGISITKAKELLQQTDKIIASHPQVAHVLGKAGRAETATDPAPLSMIETTILLKEKDQWPKGKTIEDVIKELDSMIKFPGLTNAWIMPIKTRIDMLATGIRTPVGIKIMGDDLYKLSQIGQQIEALIKQMPDTLTAYSERVTGGKYIDIKVDRINAARFGLTVEDIQDVIRSAIGGMNVTSTVEGLKRYSINVRLLRELRDDLEKLKRIPVMTPFYHFVPLGQVASVNISEGPPMIKSENSKPTAWIYVDLKTSDVGGYVAKAKSLVKSEIDIPDGFSIVWSGQYEYMERAKKRLWLVVPLTLVLIFIMLFLHFDNLAESLLVMLTLPFALIGGVWLIFLAGYDLSVAVAVGFIALAGLAAETGVVMLVYLDQAFQERIKSGGLNSLGDIKSAIFEGAVLRVRPKIMTVATSLFGLLPIMLGSETGTRVMKRIAAPMVGGLISSTILTLIILPAIYLLLKKGEYRDMLTTTKEEKRT